MATTITHAASLHQAVRLDAWRAVFEKTNRIISERPVTVEVAASAPYGLDAVPAWTNGEQITFNGPQVTATLKGKDPVSAVLALKGLNYHELSHVLYTPRMGDELPRLVQKKIKDTHDAVYWYAMNALEDQRIETWFTSVFGASRRYFEATVMNWIVCEGTVEAAPLVYGRKYLSSRIRVGAGNVFVQKHGQALYDEMKDVIDQYILVTFPGQSSKAYSLVLRFRELLRKMQVNAPLPSLPIPDNGCHQHGTGSAPDRNDPSAIRAGRIIQRSQKTAQEAAQGAMEKAEQADAEAQAAQPAPPQDMPLPGQPQDDPQTPGDGQDGDDPDDQPGGGDRPAQSGGEHVPPSATASVSQSASGRPGDQPGQGASGEVVDEVVLVPVTMKDLMEAAGAALDEIGEDPAILRDVENTLDAIRATIQNNQIDAEGQDASHGALSDASEGQKIASRKIVNILGRIRGDLEPMRSRKQTSGRINIRKFMARSPGDIMIFDQWHEGSEELASVEAVVLLDRSTSMSNMAEACGAAWAMKRAFDKLDIRSTVLVYNGGHRVLFQPSQKAKPQVPVIRADGGTDPTSAYEQALRIFAKSGAHNKILVNVTDGQWQWNDARGAQMIRTLHGMGVSTMVLGLDRAVEYYGKHYHKVGHDITSVTELPKAVLKWVSDIMRVAAQRV